MTCTTETFEICQLSIILTKTTLNKKCSFLLQSPKSGETYRQTVMLISVMLTKTWNLIISNIPLLLLWCK